MATVRDRGVRIFFLSAAQSLTDVRPSGEGLIAWNLLTSLARRGHEVVACVNESELQRDPEFEVVVLPYRAPLAALDPLVYARDATAELQRRGVASFDIAHWLFPDGAFGLRHHLLPAIPLVIGPLTLPWQASRRPLTPSALFGRAAGAWMRREQQRTLGRADGILFPYRDARRRVKRTAGRVAELPFGITLNAITRHPVPETPRVFYAGRLEAEKGLFDLLDAADRVITRLPSAEFVLAGDGSLRDALAEQIARRGLSGSVRLLGAITPAAVSHEMGLASLVCLPSHGEPFGMVLLEAMRAGRAVVATAEGGPPSIVVDGEGGRLVPTRSPEALAHAIMALLTDPVALVAAGEFNQRRVQEKYDLESVTSTLEGFYETVRRDYHR